MRKKFLGQFFGYWNNIWKITTSLSLVSANFNGMSLCDIRAAKLRYASDIDKIRLLNENLFDCTLNNSLNFGRSNITNQTSIASVSPGAVESWKYEKKFWKMYAHIFFSCFMNFHLALKGFSYCSCTSKLHTFFFKMVSF